MNDIFVYYLQLPLSVKGVVSPDEEGNYTIYINSLYNDAQRRETYDHEMRHILLGHYTQPERPVAHQEAEASAPALLKTQIVDAALKGLPARPLLEALPSPAPPARSQREPPPIPATSPARPRQESRPISTIPSATSGRPASRPIPPPGADMRHRLLRQTLTGAYY